MNLFRRRSSVDLGRYEGPIAVPVAPVSAVIDEGVLIARSAVRMAVKNRMIVAALRDGLSYDHTRFVLFAIERLAELADHEATSAERVRERRARQSPHPQLTAAEARDESVRREEIHTGLGAALTALASDPVELDRILTGAREDALGEMTANLSSAAIDDSAITVDDDYGVGKDERVAALLFIDLSELAFAQGTSLEELEGGA